MTAAVVLTGPADIRDQAWLNERIAAIETGVEAVLHISMNWTAGRQVARLHPGLSAAEYVKSQVGPLRLGKADVTVLLKETNWSNRQIASVAGMDEATVRRTAANAAVEREPEVLSGDGYMRPARQPFRPRLDPMPYFPPPVAALVAEPEPEGVSIAEAPSHWPDLVRVMDEIEALSVRDAPDVAAGVPDRRRAATAKRLRKLGTYLGRIAWTLEQIEEVQ